MANNRSYIGQELTIFAQAINWKKYYASIIKPYFGKRVVEVGAGIGATTAIMCDGTQAEWVCLEPDPNLRDEISQLISDKKLPACCHTEGGFVTDLEPSNSFDTFIYIDVLEHIEDDYAELQAASVRLSPGGHLIVLSPAFHFLYSPFDKSIGHYRRYNKKMLKRLSPKDCEIEKMMYLDSAGMATSLINRLLLWQPMPTLTQIKLWDKWMIPLSKWGDRISAYRFGRSLLGIWKRI